MTVHGHSLINGAMQLQGAMESLQQAWEIARESWDDDTRRHFEEEHLQPLFLKMRGALDGIHRFGSILDRARRECDDQSE